MVLNGGVREGLRICSAAEVVWLFEVLATGNDVGESYPLMVAVVTLSRSPHGA